MGRVWEYTYTLCRVWEYTYDLCRVWEYTYDLCRVWEYTYESVLFIFKEHLTLYTHLCLQAHPTSCRFSKVRWLLNLPLTITMQLTFENLWVFATNLKRQRSIWHKLNSQLAANFKNVLSETTVALNFENLQVNPTSRKRPRRFEKFSIISSLLNLVFTEWNS